MTKIVFISNLASTLCLCGVIWIVQLVQYPFFSEVSPQNFPKYHQAHTFWITPIVAPLMIVELITSFLVLVYTPENLNFKLLVFALMLTLVTWASTAFIQVPLHNKLANGFDRNTHTALVNLNWIRTIAWSLRGALMIYFLAKIIK